MFGLCFCDVFFLYSPGKQAKRQTSHIKQLDASLSLIIKCVNVWCSQDVTDLRKAVSQANKTEEQHHTWTDEQIHLLLSTVADLHHRVSSLENGSKQNVSRAKESFKSRALTPSECISHQSLISFSVQGQRSRISAARQQ